MKFQTAIFDMDGTLVDIHPSFEFFWTKKCFEDFTNQQVSDDEVRNYLKMSISERDAYLKGIGFDSAQQYVNMWLTQEALDARFDSLVIYSDVNALVTLKDKGLQLGLVTAAPRSVGEREKMEVERLLGVSNLFETIVYIPESSFPTKPNPLALDHCVSRMSADKDTTFYCGNLEEDVYMARNSGVTPTLIDRHNSTNLHAIPIKINNLNELVDM